MPVRRYMEENCLADMLVSDAGVTRERNLREHVTSTPLSSMKVVHSAFETQRRHHQKSKTGVSMPPQKGLTFFLKNNNDDVLFQERIPSRVKFALRKQLTNTVQF